MGEGTPISPDQKGVDQSQTTKAATDQETPEETTKIYLD